MDVYVKRINRIDDFSKLYAELKQLNRVIGSSPQEEKELKLKKEFVEKRVEELMFAIPVLR